VIADLTGGNANVMYELGLRHTRNMATIQIGEHERLPFDVITVRTHKFSRSPNGLVEARKKLIEAIGAAQAGDFLPVTATRLWNLTGDPTGHALPVDVESGADDAPGTLELLADMEDAFPSLLQSATEYSEILTKMTAVMEETTKRTKRVNAQGQNSAARLLVANDLASKLAPLVDDLEDAAARHADDTQRVDPGARTLIQQIPQATDVTEAQKKEFAEIIVNNAAMSEQLAASAEGMLAPNAEIGKLTRTLREVTGRIERTVLRFVESNSASQRWLQLLKDTWGPLG